jgi:hypothetical protein
MSRQSWHGPAAAPLKSAGSADGRDAENPASASAAAHEKTVEDKIPM